MDELNNTETLVEELVETGEEFVNSDSTAKVVAGVTTLVLVTGTALAAFVADKAGKFDGFKEARRQKKIAKYEAKLKKLTAEVPEEEEEPKF